MDDYNAHAKQLAYFFKPRPITWDEIEAAGPQIKLPRIFRKRKKRKLPLLEYQHSTSLLSLGKVKEVAPGVFEITDLTPEGVTFFNTIDNAVDLNGNMTVSEFIKLTEDSYGGHIIKKLKAFYKEVR